MAFRFNGSSNYLELSSAIVAANDPVTFLGWGKTNNVTATQILVSVSDNATAGVGTAYKMEWAGNVGGDPVRARKNSSGANASADSGAFVANRWTPTVSMWLTNTSRFAWKDFTLAAENTTNVSHSNALTRTNIGTYFSGTNRADFFNGAIAEVGIVAGGITPNEMRAFASGIPLDEIFASRRLLAYLPLHKDTGISDLGPYGYKFSNNGAVAVADHPVILRERRRKYHLVNSPSTGPTLSGAFVEASDGAAILTTVKVAGSLARTEGNDSAAITASASSNRTLSGAFVEAPGGATIGAAVKVAGVIARSESADTTSIGAAVKVSGSLTHSENADNGTGQALVKITGAASVQDGGDQFTAHGGTAEPPLLDPHFVLLAQPVSRRAAPAPRQRIYRAFPRTRRLLAA